MSLLSTIQSALGIYTPVDETKCFGADTSHWSGIVNWEVAKSTGMSFMIGKGMDGVNGPTKYFVENYNGAKKAGILTGCYSWLYKNSVLSTGAQAKAFAQLYKQYPTDIRPCIDLEWTSSGNPNAQTDLYDFLTRFEDLTGVKCMIYTAWGYWRQYGSTNQYYSQFPLWVAQYGVSQPNSFAPWNGDYTFFQFTDKANSKRYGFPSTGESGCDMNYFNGGKDLLYAWCGLTVPTTPITPTIPPIIINPPTTIPKPATVITYSVNVRSGPGTQFPISAISLPMGSKLLIIQEVKDEVGNTWGKISENKFVCMIYNGNVYVTYDLVVVVPPPVDPNIVKTTVSMNVRSGAGTNYQIVGSVIAEQSVKILEQVRGSGDSVWGRIGIEKWICLFMNGVYFTTMKFFNISVPPPVIVNPPPTSGSLGIYRIKDDLEAGVQPQGTRPFIRNGLPSTVRIRGGVGFVMLSEAWMDYVVKINNTRLALKYQFSDWDVPNPRELKPAVGWHNSGNGNRVEQLTFSGNHVEVIRIVGNQAYIKTYFNNQTPPTKIVIPMPNSLDPLVHLFSVQYPKYLDMTTDSRYPRVFPIANPGEELWMDIRDLVKI